MSVAVPLTTSWVKPVPGFAPLMLMTKFERGSSVTFPWAVRLPRPSPTVPEDVMGPTVPEPPNVPLMSITGLAGCEPSTSMKPPLSRVVPVNDGLLPRIVTVPAPSSVTVPVPLRVVALSSVNGAVTPGPPKYRVAPDSTVKAPPVLVPPPQRLRMPVWTSTVPGAVTINATLVKSNTDVLTERVERPVVDEADRVAGALLLDIPERLGQEGAVVDDFGAVPLEDAVVEAGVGGGLAGGVGEGIAVEGEIAAGRVEGDAAARGGGAGAAGRSAVASPLIVPPLSVSRPPTVMAPGSFSVPPLIVKVDEVVNADAIESVPPLIVNGAVDVRLLIVSVSLSE